MERASLRPVPARPPRGVDAGEAFAHVDAALPGLEPDAQRALAMVELSDRSRAAAAAELELGREELAQLLALARKALRRTTFPLNASGWCERAERLISDRIDGELGPPGPARLDAHLRNCDRCVEHERRLESARDALVRGFVARHPAVMPEPIPAPAPAPAEPLAEATEPAVEAIPIEDEVPEPIVAIEEPAAKPEPAKVVEPEPARVVEPEPVVAINAPAVAVARPEPAPEPHPERAAAPAPPAEKMDNEEPGFAAQAVWGFMYSLAIVLTLAAVALTVAGATGVA